MRNKISYLWIITAIIHMFFFTACEDETEQDQAAGLALKAYSPTVVMAGGEMVITGSGLNQVNSILFPGNIEVTDFEVVTSNQIKLIIPSGIDEEGGFLKIASEDKTIESSVAMRLAKPELNSMDPGDEVKTGQELTFKGVDLECIKQVIFPAKTEDRQIVINAIDFIRKASDNLKVKVPAGIKNGMDRIILVATDGTTLTSEEIKLIPSETGGENILWEDNFVIGDWDTTLNLDVSYFQKLAIGDKLRFYFTPTPGDGWQQIDLRDSADGTFPGFEFKWLGDYPDGYADLEVTQDASNRIMVGGLLVRGAFYTLTKVELIKGSPVDPSSNVIWEGEFKSDKAEGEDGFLSFKLEPSYLSNLAVGQTIRIYYKFDERNYTGYWGQGLSGINLRSGNDDNDLTFGNPQITDFQDMQLTDVGYYDLVVTQAVYDCINPNGTSPGLLIRGWKYILTKVELIQDDPIEPSNVIWKGAIDWGEGNDLLLDKDKFQNLSVNNTIRFYFTPSDEGWPQIDICDSNWSSFEGLGWIGLDNFPDGYADLIVTQDVYDRIMQGGLHIRGYFYTLTKVELI